MLFRTKLAIVFCALYGTGCAADYSSASFYEPSSSSWEDDTMDMTVADDSFGGDSFGDDSFGDDSAAFVPQTMGGSTEDFALTAGERVYFDLDSFALDDEDRAVLQKQAQWLLTYPETHVLVGGNCDERGTRDYNLALGARRANAAKEYLESLGVESDRIKTISYGKERPLDDGHNEVAWSINRNAHTKVTEDIDDS